MRLHEIDSKFDNVWNKIILTYCSDIVNTYKSNKKVFYRGMHTSDPILRGHSFNNRRPRDSYPFFSDLIDLGLTEVGMKAIRSNSYFVISDIEKTKYFGDPYIVFPVNEYEFTSTSQGDIVLNSSDFIKDYRHLFRNDVTYNYIQKIYDHSNSNTSFNDWPYFFIKKSDTLESGINKINDFLIIENHDPIDARDLIDINKIKRNLKPQNTDISIPLNKRKEVMLTGTYYAFKANVYQNQVFKLLEIQ